jgi:hypothetical protein
MTKSELIPLAVVLLAFPAMALAVQFMAMSANDPDNIWAGPVAVGLTLYVVSVYLYCMFTTRGQQC